VMKQKTINMLGKYTRHIVAAALVCLMTIVYWPVKDYPFINFDDHDYVTGNTHVHSGITIESIRWAFSTVKNDEVAYWHPLTWLSHMLDCQLFGMEPGLHHLSNLAYHLLNVVLLFYLLVIMTGCVWESALAAALFALHPINVDSVAWIAERKNLLSTVFWFITMMAYVYYALHPSISRYMIIVVAFLLGLMAKPMLVTLPCVLLLMDYWPLYRLQWGQRPTEKGLDSSLHPKVSAFQKASLIRLVFEKVPLLMLALGFIALWVITFHTYSETIKTADIPFSLRLSNAVVSYGVYLKKMIWPTDLAFYYPFPESIPLWKPLIMTVGLIAATGFFLFRARKSPYLIIGWLWYLGTLIPVIGLVQGGLWPAVADRWAYVPLIGIFIMIAWGLSAIAIIFPSKTVRAIWPASGAIILLLLCIQTRTQLGYWENNETFFGHAIEVTDRNWFAHDILAEIYAKSGNTAKAMYHFTRALDIKPNDFRTLKGFAFFLVQNGDPDRALELFQKALWMDPRETELLVAMGDAFLFKDDPQQAIYYYSKALLTQPDRASIQNNLGNAYLKMENFEQATHAYERAISLDSDDPDGYYNLGLVRAQFGDNEEALRLYRIALVHDPDYDKAHQKIAEIMFRQNRLDEALKHYQEALRVAPEDEKNYYNIGVVLAMMGKPREAAAQFEKALKINPRYHQAQIALIQVTRQGGRSDGF
jgi:protein O-mannosyl-transferase